MVLFTSGEREFVLLYSKFSLVLFLHSYLRESQCFCTGQMEHTGILKKVRFSSSVCFEFLKYQGSFIWFYKAVLAQLKIDMLKYCLWFEGLAVGVAAFDALMLVEFFSVTHYSWQVIIFPEESSRVFLQSKMRGMSGFIRILYPYGQQNVLMYRRQFETVTVGSFFIQRKRGK